MTETLHHNEMSTYWKHMGLLRNLEPSMQSIENNMQIGSIDIPLLKMIERAFNSNERFNETTLITLRMNKEGIIEIVMNDCDPLKIDLKPNSCVNLSYDPILKKFIKET